MALIKLGALVTRISGKVGGQSFGTGPAGSYIKNTGTPRKSITLSQHSKMSQMATTAQKWRKLTQAQRDVFINASPDYTYLNRVGETKNYSGYAIYTQQVNNLRQTAGGIGPSQIPVPLPRQSFVPLTSPSITGVLSSLKFEANGGEQLVDYRIFLTRIGSQGVTRGYRNFFFINVGVYDIATNMVKISITSSYVNRFGAMPLSGKFYYRVDAVHVPTGQSLNSVATGVYSY